MLDQLPAVEVFAAAAVIVVVKIFVKAQSQFVRVMSDVLERNTQALQDVATQMGRCEVNQERMNEPKNHG